MAHLPIIDLEPFVSGDAAGRHGVARAIGGACESTGFFYLCNHGVPASTMSAALDASRRFFALPDRVKRAARRRPGHYRGYIATTPFSEDRTTGEAFLYEAFVVGEEAAPEDPECLASEGLYWPNTWPAEPSDFRATVASYWDAVTELSRRLLRAFALALGQSEDALTAYFRKPLTNLSLLHYPARSADAGEDDARAHYDTDVATILLPGEVGGLQVMHREREWMDVEPLPGCFVVNIGNMLEVWSGGRFRSTMHRVHPPVGLDRYSIAYFAHPGYDTLIKPLAGMPPMRVEGKPAEIHAGKDLAAFVAKFDAG